MSTPEPAPAQRSILVVDDEAIVRRLVCRMLEDADYSPVSAASGKEALEIIDRQVTTFNLFMLDIRLPDISGLRLASKIQHRYPNTPILFMSGFPEAGAGASPAGTWAYLSKPFGQEQLETMLVDLLDRSGTPQDVS